ncbi:MAG: ketoacyl-ACP synthase III [Proteobacteria bacterium]|nr:ketoacyl-ACP synthase III [Pseudomonadota bacterium]
MHAALKSSQTVAVEIAGTSAIAPGRKVTTEAVVAAAHGFADKEKFELRVRSVKRKTGIETRYFAGPDDLCENLGTEALRIALSEAGIEPQALERIIFVSSGLGDLVFPATANLICRGLEIRDTCDCFDLNNACMGFLTALDIAACGIAAGSGPVGIVVADFPTRATTPTDIRPYLVFGDALAAVVVKKAASGGILASFLRNDGITFGNVLLRNSAITGVRETIQFTDYNEVIEDQAIEALKKCISVVLERTNLSMADMDWILPHQPNGEIFNNIVSEFQLPAEKIVPVAIEIGSTGAAAIPYSLDRLIRTRNVVPGDRILFAGVGGGIAYGAMIYEVPRS